MPFICDSQNAKILKKYISHAELKHTKNISNMPVFTLYLCCNISFFQFQN